MRVYLEKKPSHFVCEFKFLQIIREIQRILTTLPHNKLIGAKSNMVFSGQNNFFLTSETLLIYILLFLKLTFT